MHALLGLAAPHLVVTDRGDSGATAINHRLVTIKGFNAAVSKGPLCSNDGNALLASCYALGFQASYMADGMQEFFQSFRGCNLVSHQMMISGIPVAFLLTRHKHFEVMEDRLNGLPTVNSELVEGAEKSLDAMLGLCELPINRQIHGLLAAVITALRDSSIAGRHLLVPFMRINKVQL
jgi:hypothetical protein